MSRRSRPTATTRWPTGCVTVKQEVGITGWDSDADAFLRDDGGSSGDNTIWRHKETSIGPYETILFSGLAVYGTNAVDARNQYDSLGDEACNGVVLTSTRTAMSVLSAAAWTVTMKTPG